ncbi:MAG: aldo/keto reductase [Treponema sp.]|nr:aldo/keto reductase [Treponema sp.]
MIYREYGQTGKKVSLLGFGGMRFAKVDDHEECAKMMVTAAEGGVTYFDTAPGYFETRSEKAYGAGFKELKKRNLPFYSASKTFASTEAEIRKEVEGSLKRMGLSQIDFYHIWCITSLGGWEGRKKDGVLTAFRKLKEEGLIGHICVSSHLVKDEIKELLMEGVFEGVLFGYSAYDFPTREAAFDAVRAKKLGAVVMNPLGGGLIPDHPERFGFLCKNGESVVSGALRFLWDHSDITTSLVGFATLAHVKEALAAMDSYQPRNQGELDAIKALSQGSLDGICTGCGYCDKCPQGVPIPKFMDTYNQKILAKAGDKDPMGDRLRDMWDLSSSLAATCNQCGLCEEACTQHIPIIERLKEIAAL